MIEDQYLYVDKTRHILELLNAGKYIFLSRPRRFGKSLLVSTLKEIFSGNKELFQGLFIYDKIDWQTYPVIHLDLSRVSCDDDKILKQSLISSLTSVACDFNITLSEKFLKDRFFELIKALYTTSQQKVVVLIDEYDKPIIDFAENPEQAKKNRNVLKDFYGILKGGDQYIRFVFLTGVSKFSRVSIFSGLNNLNDITLSSRYATLLGYTQEELESYFADYIQQYCKQRTLSQDHLLAKIRTWYNGYSWNGEDTVYNPVSVLKLFDEQKFGNYWFATGTPTFLIQLVKRMHTDITQFDNKIVSDILFESYDLDNMNILALLFQTGYLTITNMVENEEDGTEYTLNFPNREVKDAFLTYLFEGFTTQNKSDVQIAAHQLRRCLQRNDLQEFITIIRSMFAKIPYTLHIEEEAYYHSLFYMIAALMGVDINLEVLTDKGRIDGVLEFEDKVYVIEFKYGKAGSDMETLTDKAVQQIQEKNYAERYRNDPRTCFLLGVGFVEKKIGYKIVRS